MPPGTEVRGLESRDYSFLAPGMPQTVRVTTDPTYHEENSESAELWSPGNPFCEGPELLPETAGVPADVTLKDLLERRRGRARESQRLVMAWPAWQGGRGS